MKQNNEDIVENVYVTKFEILYETDTFSEKPDSRNRNPEQSYKHQRNWMCKWKPSYILNSRSWWHGITSEFQTCKE